MKSVILLAAFSALLQISSISAEPNPLLGEGAGSGGLVGNLLTSLLGGGAAPIVPLPIPITLPVEAAPPVTGAGGYPGTALAAATGGPLGVASATNTGIDNNLSGIGNSVSNVVDLDLARK